MTSALTADALAELKRLDAAVTAAQGFIGSAEAGLEFGAALRKAFPALLSELEQSRVERKEMMEALVQARGALLLDHMVDDDGEPFGTTAVAVEAVDAVLSRARQRTQTGG